MALTAALRDSALMAMEPTPPNPFLSQRGDRHERAVAEAGRGGGTHQSYLTRKGVGGGEGHPCAVGVVAQVAVPDIDICHELREAPFFRYFSLRYCHCPGIAYDEEYPPAILTKM